MRAMRMQIVGSAAGTAGLIGFVRVGGGRVYADEWVEVSVQSRGGGRVMMTMRREERDILETALEGLLLCFRGSYFSQKGAPSRSVKDQQVKTGEVLPLRFDVAAVCITTQ